MSRSTAPGTREAESPLAANATGRAAPPAGRRLALEAATLAGLVFLVYALGACRTIFVGDSGELVAAVGVLGIPHPSGYPLYVLLGKLWTLLVPVGSIAFRMSLFSAACAASACGVLHLLLRRLGLHASAAATAALLLAVSPSLWGEANIQRVYALNLLFVLLVVATAFEWQRSGRDLALLAACFLCGLGATNHTFLGIAAFALGLFALAEQPGLLRRPLMLLAMPAAALAGLLPYAYLPLRSRMDPPLDWGNPETLEAFLNTVLRRDFWNRAYWEGPADAIPIAADYFSGLAGELLYAGAALSLVGLLAARQRRWPVVLPLLVMAANALAVGLHGSRSDIFIWHRYYIPSYAMAALLAGLGVQVVIERGLARAADAGVRAPGAAGAAAGGRAPVWRAFAWVPLALPLVGLVVHWREFDRSRYRIADDFSRQLLATLPPGAHLSASDDNILFVLIYLKLVEGLRPDVDLILQGVGGAALPPLRFNPDSEGLYFTHHPNWQLPQLRVVPVGLVFRVVRAGSPLPPLLLPARPLAGADDADVPQDYLTQNLVGQWHYMLGSTFEARDWPRAWTEFQQAARASPDNDVLFFNLGLIYSGQGLWQEALGAFERSHEINPRPIASHQKAQASSKVAETRRELERLQAVVARLSEALPQAGTAAYHRALAERLEAAGETLAANGQRLRALLADRGGATTP